MAQAELAFRATESTSFEIDRDAARENMSPVVAWAVFWFPLAGLAALCAAALILRPAYDKILAEDYPVEWSQFAFCLFNSVVAFLAAQRYARRRHYAIAATLFLLAFGTFMLAGEEISWGQRVFGVATPGELASVNDQSEMNLHNITVGFDLEAVFRQISLVIAVIGTTVTLLARRTPPVLRAAFWQTLSPPLFSVSLFAMMIGYRIYRIFEAGEVNFAVRMQEWLEFCLYFGMLIAVVCIFLKAPREAPGAGVGPSWVGRHARRSSTERNRRTLTLIAINIVVLTLIFAVLTLSSGIKPVN